MNLQPFQLSQAFVWIGSYGGGSALSGIWERVSSEEVSLLRGFSERFMSWNFRAIFSRNLYSSLFPGSFSSSPTPIFTHSKVQSLHSSTATTPGCRSYTCPCRPTPTGRQTCRSSGLANHKDPAACLQGGSVGVKRFPHMLHIYIYIYFNHMSDIHINVSYMFTYTRHHVSMFQVHRSARGRKGDRRL